MTNARLSLESGVFRETVREFAEEALKTARRQDRRGGTLQRGGSEEQFELREDAIERYDLVVTG